MQEQYYFPSTIEELSIGMEVELIVDNKFESYKFEESSDFVNCVYFPTIKRYNLEELIHLKEIRIPYLTSKDIEDEGFKLIDDKEIYSPKFKTDTKNKDFSLGDSEYYYEIVKYNQSKNSISCEIHLTLIREEGSITLPLFNGTIKNKQDFKRLLIQLGIK
jgi:hypothetical protein